MGALTNSSRGMDLGAVTYAHLGHNCGSFRCPCALRLVCVCAAKVAAVAAGVWDSVTDAQNLIVQVVNELVPDVTAENCMCVFFPWGLGTSGRRQCQWMMGPVSVTLSEISGHLVQQQ